MDRIITSEILVAYSQCHRKAYLILCSNQKGTQCPEYIRILELRQLANQNKHINILQQKNPNIQCYSLDNLHQGGEILINALLKTDGLEANCAILTKVVSSSSLDGYGYEPTIFSGTYSISREQRLELLFISFVLERLQHQLPRVGRIIELDGRPRKIALDDSHKVIIPLLEPLQEWATISSLESPPVILNKHCPYCQFQNLCQTKAEQEDNLSLLDGVTSKIIRGYEKKGIFTVKQLSYLAKPRKHKKHTKNPPPAIHKFPFQALAIKTGKIYVQELPELTRQPIELFLDIEGIPDQQFYYLIGLLICDSNTNASTYYSFWADTHQDEAQMWQQFLEKVRQYPNAPIYHYGSYEPRSINKLAEQYTTDIENFKNHLVNVNRYIYGKIYFPVRSNGLKKIGNFIGATWTFPNVSGLQALAWRHYWDETHDIQYQELLLTYNQEDCQALKLLTDELSKIKDSVDLVSDSDILRNQPKRRSTKTDNPLHYQLETILGFSYSNYGMVQKDRELD